MLKMTNYNKDINELIKFHQSDLEKGLSQTEADARKTKLGPNAFGKEKKLNPFLVFIKNFIEPLIIILLAIAILSFVIKE